MKLEAAKEELKDSLVKQISTFEVQLAAKYSDLNKRLDTKEKAIAQIKQLFVQKLRELETNFAEIGDHLIAKQGQEAKEKEQEVEKSE